MIGGMWPYDLHSVEMIKKNIKRKRNKLLPSKIENPKRS
jgi:hypothetical protein